MSRTCRQCGFVVVVTSPAVFIISATLPSRCRDRLILRQMLIGCCMICIFSWNGIQFWKLNECKIENWEESWREKKVKILYSTLIWWLLCWLMKIPNGRRYGKRMFMKYFRCNLFVSLEPVSHDMVVYFCIYVDVWKNELMKNQVKQISHLIDSHLAACLKLCEILIPYLSWKKNLKNM